MKQGRQYGVTRDGRFLINTISSATLALVGNGSGRISLSTPGVGWARASASPAANVIGTETIQLFNGQGVLVMEAGVLAAQPDLLLRLPAVENTEFGTGVAVVNLGSSANTANFILRSADGTTANSTTGVLAPNEQTAKFVNELFPGWTSSSLAGNLVGHTHQRKYSVLMPI